MSDHVSISDFSQWPPQVSEISHYLTGELPPSLLSSHPTLSPRASQLWTEVIAQYPPSTSYEGLPHGLVVIVNTLLSTVSIIRTLRDSNATSRETRPFVSLLFCVLLRFCYPDAHVSDNIRFALSYLDKVGNKTVGDATMLASVVSPLSGDSADDTMSDDPLSTKTNEIDEESDTLSEVYPQMRTCMTRHDHRSVAFPFVCIADERSIFQILRSTTYQRITWGIQDPVIGIALSESGLSAQIYFAWADQHSRGGGMPPVQCVSSSKLTALCGVFNLSSPDSTLLFATFLLSLRPQYHTFSQQCRVARFSDLMWRADSKIDDQKRTGTESWDGEISSWLHDVQPNFSTSKEVQASLPTPPRSSSKSPSRSHSDLSDSPAGSTLSFGPRRSSTSSRLSQNQVASDNQITRQPPNRQREHVQEKVSKASRSSSERSTSPLAASESCARSEKGISGEDLSTESILYDRNVVEVSRIRLAIDDTSLSDAALPDKPCTETRALIEEINEVVAGYDALTGYRPLPAKFSVQAESILHPLCEVLMAEMKALEDIRQNLDDEDPNEIALEPLDEGDASQITESMSLLLWTVERTRRVNASVDTGNEAVARLCWEVLIYLSFTGLTENVSPRVLLERLLPLPLNSAADSIASGQAENLKASSLKRAKINRDLCSAAYVLGPRLTPDVRTQFEAVFAAAYARQVEVRQFLRGDYANVILERAGNEPDKAKCDCVIAFPAPKLEKSLRYPFLRLSAPPIPSDEDSKFSCQLGERPGKPLLPVFLGSYKKLNESPIRAVQQLKLHLVSAVVFLASIGFKKHPVYGLSTNGTVGAILCCWYSEVEDIVFIMDRNVRSFDISSPMEMYQFATFMLRLRRWSDRALAQLVEEHLGQLEQKKWTKMEQDEELFPDRKQTQTTTTTRTGAVPRGLNLRKGPGEVC